MFGLTLNPTVDVGTAVQIIGTAAGGLWFLWRVCLRFDQLDKRIDSRIDNLVDLQAQRAEIQDRRHDENVRRLERIENELMSRARPPSGR